MEQVFLLYIITSVSYRFAFLRFLTTLLVIVGCMLCSLNHLAISNYLVIGQNNCYEILTGYFPLTLNRTGKFPLRNIFVFTITRAMIKRKISIYSWKMFFPIQTIHLLKKK